jgi:hypothetical protein
MQLPITDVSHRWYTYLFCSTTLKILRCLIQLIYLAWFTLNRCLVDLLKKHVSPFLGLCYGMLALEGHTLCKAAWYTIKTYRKKPYTYGFDCFNGKPNGAHPVLLLHGAVGSWSYLGDLAMTLKTANIPVFVMNLGFGLPTDEMRANVFNKINDIRKAYVDVQLNYSAEKISDSTMITPNSLSSNEIPLVDIVAHSNGGNLALYSAFTADCSYIDENNELKFRDVPRAHAHVGKIITIALPSNTDEVDWMRQVNKSDHLYNINAKYDALMGHKTCALTEELCTNATNIDAAHIGIAFQLSTYQQVIEYLLHKID